MALFITPQIQTVPSLPWAVLQAPTLATPTQHYQGHLPGSGVQIHSSDDAYRHGIVMVAHESATGRRLWMAMKGQRVVACHPRESAARFMALAVLVGA